MFCKGKVTIRLSLTLLAVYTSQHGSGQKYFSTWQDKVFDFMFKFQKRVALGGSQWDTFQSILFKDQILHLNEIFGWQFIQSLERNLSTSSCFSFWLGAVTTIPILHNTVRVQYLSNVPVLQYVEVTSLRATQYHLISPLQARSSCSLN
jgi:membrane associated rhomboid family serine protease